MAKLYNLARMSTGTTGTGTITLGSAVTGFLSFAAAGVGDGDTVTYAIQDGSSSEIGRGVYAASGTTLTRAVLKSTNSGSAINLSGTAQVFITAAAEDFLEILDEDNFASDSATKVPSQQSTKAYVDAKFSRCQVFTSSGTFTPPSGCYWVVVEVWGGGGGSGGTGASNRGAGGGGGGYGRQTVAVVPGSGVTVTVGAGGAAGDATPSAGGNGGTSSFGVYSATGGTGSAAATGVIGGGAGGTSSMTFNVSGSAGQANNYVSGATAAGAGGGAFGTGQAFPNAGAVAPGGGAYGNANTSAAGLAGGNGRVVVWY